MNKTVTINISGIIFHIEEDAFEALRTYLQRLRERFSREEGRDEIMADIESRIAELLKSKTSLSKEVVVMADVDEVIAVMGQPEAFEGEETADNQESAQNQTNNQEQQQQSGYTRRGYTRRRLFRDPDDRIVSGVCSGIGHYFDINPLWLRLAFAISFFVFGSGFLLYLILMVIMPKAETTAEKLEMRGEPVDVNNISRSIREDFDTFGRRVEDLGEEATSWARRKFGNKRYTSPPAGTNYSDYRYERSARRGESTHFFTRVFDLIGRFFAIALLIVGIGLLIAFLTSTFTFSDIGPAVVGHNLHKVFSESYQYPLFIVAFLLVFGIPILMLIYTAVRILFNIKVKNKVIGFTALSLWIIGVIIGIYVGVDTSGNFAESNRVTERFQLVNAKMDTLQIEVMIDPDMENRDYNNRYNRKYHYGRRYSIFAQTGNEMKFGTHELHIVESKTDSFELVIYKYSQGQTYEQALLLARNVRYNLRQEGNRLIFPSYFTIGENQSWRAQNMMLELRVPRGKVIYLDKSASELIYDVENIQNVHDNDMTGRRWQMTASGLTCIDCGGLESMDGTPITVSGVPDSVSQAKRNLDLRIERMADSMRRAAGKK